MTVRLSPDLAASAEDAIAPPPPSPPPQAGRGGCPAGISNFPMPSIESIDWTNITTVGKFRVMQSMDTTEQPQEFETEPSAHECECPEPCNCDHENE